MNDRFKFRVWDKKHNEYIPSNMIGTLLYFGYRDGFHIEFECFSTFADSLIIEQCTGLKDKNGNLVYEGDIIKIPDDWETYGCMSGEEREVYFCDGGFRLKPNNTKAFRGHWLEQTDDLEIIGNIHEIKRGK